MRLKRFLSILFTFLFLATALYFLEWDQLKFTLQKFNPWVLSLAIFVSFVHFLVFGVRWQQIVHEVTLPIPFWQHVTDYLYGVFVESFTPANIGGDFYRSIVLRKYRVLTSKILMLIARDHFLGFFAHLILFFLLLVGAVYFDFDHLDITWNLFLMVASGTVITICLMLLTPFILDMIGAWRWTKKKNILIKIFTNLREAVRFRSPWEFVRLIGITLIGLVFWVLTVYIVALDLGIELSFITIGMISVMVEMVRMVPLTIQGIGLREGIFAHVFNLLNLSPEHGFMLGLISYIAMNLSMLISGLLILFPSFQVVHLPEGENGPVI